MRKVEKPWGYENIWAETEKYVGKFMFIKAGHRMSLQYHEIKEETIYVQDGVLRVWHSEKPGDFTDLSAGEVYHVTPKTVHRFGATSAPVYLIEISTSELDDVVRLADDYKR
tara:strand:- start:319 stop:654 length:336 start_codon:yes stop_codon:yes gene_type:complete